MESGQIHSTAGTVVHRQFAVSEYGASENEMAIRVRLDAKEDAELLVYDCSVDGHEYSGRISNANHSPIKHNSEVILHRIRKSWRACPIPCSFLSAFELSRSM